MCYINTANLDGETNLKIRQALSETNEEDAYSLRGTLTCDPPNPDMYERAVVGDGGMGGDGWVFVVRMGVWNPLCAVATPPSHLPFLAHACLFLHPPLYILFSLLLRPLPVPHPPFTPFPPHISLLICIRYSFNGKLEVGSETYALANNQVVLRGAKLKNTRWIHGLVVYTGAPARGAGAGIFG